MTRHIRSLRLLCLFLFTLILAGCLEIAGQRITLRYDAPRDELHILVQYDGIHDSGNDQHGKGEEQLAKAVKDGTVMLLDWPFTFDLGEIRRNPASDEAKPLKEFVAALLANVTVEAVGYHRDPDGRIGGTQHITIRKAKDFIAKLNAAIDYAIFTDNSEPESTMARTIGKIRQTAAKGGHAWVAIDGNALVFNAPVHMREWAVMRAQFLRDSVMSLLTPGDDEDQKKKAMKDFEIGVQMLCAAPLSYSEGNGSVTLRIGDPAAPSTLRFETGKTYKANLEKAVEKHAPRDTDKVMAKLLLGGNAEKADEPVAAILSWAPVEDRVRAVLGAARGNDAAQAAKAHQWLEKFATTWNTEQNEVPAAPAVSSTKPGFLELWDAWYQQMLRFPLPQDEDAEQKK